MNLQSAKRLVSNPAAQSVMLLIVDVGIVWGSTALAYFLRFQGVVPPNFMENVVPVALVATGVFVLLFYMFRLYHQVLRYIGFEMVVRAAGACAAAFTAMALAVVFTTPSGATRPVPIGTLFILTLFTFLGAVSLRSWGRVAMYVQAQTLSSGARRALLIGAGDAGSLLLQDVRAHPGLGLRVVGILDDDPQMQGRLIRGAKVVGTTAELQSKAVELEADEILLAVPSATPAERRTILEAVSAAGLPARIVRMPTEHREPGVGDLHRVSIEDLLGREPVTLDMEPVRKRVEGRCVAVTGAAGSIGSELCRQIAAMGPSRLVLVELDETRLYEVFLEISDLGTTTPVMHLCDIRDDRKVAEVFTLERPAVVLHCAAYKHVPLMEIEPDEAVKTNVQGTRNVLRACEIAGVERFVMISTDKAVDPTTVMGLTKSIAERLTLDSCRRGLHACAVRFGNVLGSRGSVIPLFEEQMRRGGNLRVTHPEVTRYFMTIPEAARLVLQTLAISEGGEIFVLDMGDPVRIVDLAKRMIVLSGAGVSIEFTGLRPAEKLHEVLVQDSEALLPTAVEKISKVSTPPIVPADFADMIGSLGMFARVNDRAEMKKCLARIAPEFVGDGENFIDRSAVVTDQDLFTDEERLF